MRTTNAQIAERILLVAQQLARGAYNHQVHQAITTRYKVGWRTADNYLSRARALLLSGVQVNRGELIAQSFGFYRSILAAPDATIGDKLKAQQCIDDLFALHAPRTQHHEVSGPNGVPLAPPVTDVRVLGSLMDNGRGDRSPPSADVLAQTLPTPKALADTTAPSPPAEMMGF
jgi:hypothetical protein